MREARSGVTPFSSPSPNPVLLNFKLCGAEEPEAEAMGGQQEDGWGLDTNPEPRLPWDRTGWRREWVTSDVPPAASCRRWDPSSDTSLSFSPRQSAWVLQERRPGHRADGLAPRLGLHQHHARGAGSLSD